MTHRKTSLGARRAGAFLIVVAAAIAAALPAFAAVTLTAFRATPQADNTILVYWAAATELETASYQLFRSETASPENWGAPVDQQAAQGSVAPAEYQYVDRAAAPGVTYYYRLVDISVKGTPTEHGTRSARILLAGETPTITPSPTATLNVNVPTATTGPIGSAATPTPTTPPPTATRRFTNTPVLSPIGTPVLSAPTSPVVAGRATATRLPAASVATPTGQPPAPTAAAPATFAPTVAPVVPLSSTDTPTVMVATDAPAAGLETATSVPTREVTPIIFEASETREVGGSEQAVAAQGSRDMAPVLAAGGALLGLAGIATAILLFLRSRKG